MSDELKDINEDRIEGFPVTKEDPSVVSEDHTIVNKDDHASNDQSVMESNGDHNKNSALKELFSWVKIIVIAAVVAYVLNNFVIINANVPTGSMETTISAKSRIFGLRLSYWFSEPKRGDIVVFKFPDNESENYVKRVIGLPGETIELIEGKVYINGDYYEEDYLNAALEEGDFGPYEVPEDSYFMLGDNRTHSSDSRAWKNTFVHKDKILGRAYGGYWPKLYLFE